MKFTAITVDNLKPLLASVEERITVIDTPEKLRADSLASDVENLQTEIGRILEEKAVLQDRLDVLNQAAVPTPVEP